MQAHYGVLKFFGRRRSKLTLKQSVELKYLNQFCQSYNYSALYLHETYKQTYYNCIRIMILFFQDLNGQSLFLITSNHFLPWSYINEFRTRHHIFSSKLVNAWRKNNDWGLTALSMGSLVHLSYVPTLGKRQKLFF